MDLAQPFLDRHCILGREAVAIHRNKGDNQSMEFAQALHDLAVVVWGENRPAEAEEAGRKKPD